MNFPVLRELGHWEIQRNEPIILRLLLLSQVFSPKKRQGQENKSWSPGHIMGGSPGKWPHFGCDSEVFFLKSQK